MANTENPGARPAVSGSSRPLAITSVVLSGVGILSWFASIGLIAVPIIVGGLVAGHLALGRIRRAGGGGRWIAVAGLVIGYAGVAIIVCTFASAFAFFGAWLLSGSH